MKGAMIDGRGCRGYVLLRSQHAGLLSLQLAESTS